MKSWIFSSVSALILWGFWGFLGKVSSQNVPNKTLLLLGSLGFAIAFPITYLLFPRELRFNIRNINYYYALTSGIFAGIGVLFFYIALEKGDSSKVVAFTAMYPLVTFLLSFTLLHESLTIYKITGIIFAVTAAILLSI